MKAIKTIVKDIREELEGAEHYAKLAVQYKDENRQLADSYSKIAQSELNHIDVFHSQAVRMIQEQRTSGVQVPAAMQAVWDWEHEKMIDGVARIKTILSLYNG